MGFEHEKPVPRSGSCATDVVDTSPIRSPSTPSYSRFHREDIHYEGEKGVSAIARPRDFRGRPPRASITRAHPWSAPLHMSTRLHESSVTVKSIATRVGIAACPRLSSCFPSLRLTVPGLTTTTWGKEEGEGRLQRGLPPHSGHT